jgi:hypothetical protein
VVGGKYLGFEGVGAGVGRQVHQGQGLVQVPEVINSPFGNNEYRGPGPHGALGYFEAGVKKVHMNKWERLSS